MTQNNETELRGLFHNTFDAIGASGEPDLTLAPRRKALRPAVAMALVAVLALGGALGAFAASETLSNLVYYLWSGPVETVAIEVTGGGEDGDVSVNIIEIDPDDMELQEYEISYYITGDDGESVKVIMNEDGELVLEDGTVIDFTESDTPGVIIVREPE